MQIKAISQHTPVYTINYFGLHKTKLSFVEGYCASLKNVALDSTAIEKTVRFFKTLPSFSNVTYSTEPYDNGYVLNLFFEENKTFLPAATAFRSINGVSVRTAASENNFLGRNISISGFYQYNNYHSYYIGIKAPYLFNKSTGIEINNQNLNSLEPLYIANESAIYRYQLTNIEVLLIKTIRLRHMIKAGISFFKDDYQIFSKFQTQNSFKEDVMLRKRSNKAVSYTHLTLPTKRIV